MLVFSEVVTRKCATLSSIFICLGFADYQSDTSMFTQFLQKVLSPLFKGYSLTMCTLYPFNELILCVQNITVKSCAY